MKSVRLSMLLALVIVLSVAACAPSAPSSSTIQTAIAQTQAAYTPTSSPKPTSTPTAKPTSTLTPRPTSTSALSRMNLLTRVTWMFSIAIDQNGKIITLGEGGDIAIKYNANGTYNASSGSQAITGKWSFRNNETQFVDESQAGQRSVSDILELSPTVFRARDVESRVEAIFVPISPNLAAPKQISPPDGATFNVFPRTTTLRWSSVVGALGYKVQIDCYSCCEGYKWCTDVGGESSIVRVKDTNYTFEWVGAQKGRWRVWAIDETGEGLKTDWWIFDHKQ